MVAGSLRSPRWPAAAEVGLRAPRAPATAGKAPSRRPLLPGCREGPCASAARLPWAPVASAQPRAAPCSWRLGKAPARPWPGSLGRRWPPCHPRAASGRRCRAPPAASALPALRWLPEKPSVPPIPWGLGMAPARRRPTPLVVGALRAARTPAVAGGAATSRPPTHRQQPGKASAPPACRRPLGKAPSRCPFGSERGGWEEGAGRCGGEIMAVMDKAGGRGGDKCVECRRG